MPKSEKEIWSYFRKEIQHIRIGRERETDRRTLRDREQRKNRVRRKKNMLNDRCNKRKAE